MPNNRPALDNRLLSAAVQASVNGIVITDSAGKIQWVNPAFTAMTGYAPDEVIGRNPRLLKSGEHPPEFYSELWQEITAGRPWRGEMINRRNDGSLYTEELTITPIVNESGEIGHFIAIQQDISARKQAEFELERSRSRLELGLEATRQGLWDWNLASGVVYFSRQYYLMLGYGPDEIGTDYGSWRDLLHPNDLGPAVQAVQDYLAGLQRTYEVEFRLRKKSGEYIQVRSRGEIVSWDEAGRPTRVIGTHTDITERKRMEQQLRQAQKMEAIGLLAGGIAHDFNNILTVVNGYSDLINESAGTLEQAREYSRMIQHAGAEATGLVRQLMAFSRTQVREPVLLDIKTTITGMETILRCLLPENIKFVTRLDPNTAPVFADPSQLHQVVMNLSINARDAMPHGGRLEIETGNVEVDGRNAGRQPSTAPGSYVLIAVSDTGVGMDEQTQQHLFEPFYTTKAMGGGTGLGLSTVYGIVKQNGGWIWVYSEKGIGSTFKVYLPRAEGTVTARAEAAKATDVRGNETVLLVEDNVEVRGLLAKALQEYGYTVLPAGCADEAIILSKSSRGRIDLLITDVILPGTNGREVSEQMKSLRPDIAVLFISGYTGNMIATQGVLEHGANFLQKPFTGDALAARVREILKKHNQSIRILVVDDDPNVLAFVAQILSDAGYEVFTAQNGKRAVETIQKTAIDIVITDLVMPDQEGLETILRLRKTFPAVRIIAMSGAFGGEFLSTARALGARATLLKPITPEILLSNIRQVLQ